MDKLPIEMIKKIINNLPCYTAIDVLDIISFISAITHKHELLERYIYNKITEDDIKIIKYFIPLDHIPSSSQYCQKYLVIFSMACRGNQDNSRLLDYKPNKTNYHSTSSNTNRRHIHNCIKNKLMKLNLPKSKQFKLMIKILNYITSKEVDQVCLNMEWLLYLFYMNFLDSLSRPNIAKDVKENIEYFFVQICKECHNDSCKTCSLILSYNYGDTFDGRDKIINSLYLN